MNQAVQQVKLPKGRVRIYACGGAAINIATLLKNISLDPNMLADLEVVLVDTSRSNLASHTSEASTYLVEGLDGSGKVRSENSGEIRDRILDILQQHKPGDLSIVLSSAAGGSGSVIAPMLMSELLGRGLSAVALTVGSTSSKLEAINTLNTIKSFEAISQKRGMPVVMHYLQNSPSLKRSEVDLQMVATITHLAILFSRRNRELDSKDLANWLNFSKDGVTSFSPQLSTLTVLWHEANDKSVNTSLAKLGNVISVATLAPEHTNTDLDQPPEYQTVGILPNMTSGKGENNVAGKVFNFVISDGTVNEIAKGLSSFIDEIAQANKARPSKSSIVSAAEADNDGMVY